MTPIAQLRLQHDHQHSLVPSESASTAAAAAMQQLLQCNSNSCYNASAPTKQQLLQYTWIHRLQNGSDCKQPSSASVKAHTDQACSLSCFVDVPWHARPQASVEAWGLACHGTCAKELKLHAWSVCALTEAELGCLQSEPFCNL